MGRGKPEPKSKYPSGAFPGWGAIQAGVIEEMTAPRGSMEGEPWYSLQLKFDSFDHESSLSSYIMIENPLNRFFDVVSHQCIT